jgi:hypothetical protein
MEHVRHCHFARSIRDTQHAKCSTGTLTILPPSVLGSSSSILKLETSISSGVCREAQVQPCQRCCLTQSHPVLSCPARPAPERQPSSKLAPPVVWSSRLFLTRQRCGSPTLADEIPCGVFCAITRLLVRGTSEKTSIRTIDRYV